MSTDSEFSLLEAALIGFEAQKVKIEEHISAVRSQLGLRGPGRPRQSVPKPELPTPERKKRHLSAAGRRAIIDAAKKRWAAVRAQREAAAAPARQRRKMSATAKRRIIVAQKKRWAAFRAEQEAAKKVPAKAAKKVPAKAATTVAAKATKNAAPKKVKAKAPVRAAKRARVRKTVEASTQTITESAQ
jgi:hypothetical protein